MGKLVLRLREGGLEVIKREPLVPHSESPVPNDRRVRLERRVEGAAGAVGSKKGEDGVKRPSRP